MADEGQKTEQPTAKRKQKAQSEGRFPVSRELFGSIQLIAFVWVVIASYGQVLGCSQHLTESLLHSAFTAELSRRRLQQFLGEALIAVLHPAALLASAVLVLPFALHLASTRLGFSLKKLAPDASRFSPLQRLKGLPAQNWPAVLQAVLALLLGCLLLYRVVYPAVASIAMMPLVPASVSLAQLGVLLKGMFWQAASICFLFGILDFIRQQRKFSRDMRMSKQEIRDEHKESEGNPQLKGHIRRLQRDMVRRRMMQEVPTASAVVVNPTHFAVAIRYSLESMAAPTVVAKGKNYLALRIKAKAIEHEIPIIENPPLAQSLYKSVDVGQEIPAHLYRAVAEILAYVYRLMNGRMPGSA